VIDDIAKQPGNNKTRVSRAKATSSAVLSSEKTATIGKESAISPRTKPHRRAGAARDALVDPSARLCARVVH
jgi:hypothetical protein